MTARTLGTPGQVPPPAAAAPPARHAPDEGAKNQRRRGRRVRGASILLVLVATGLAGCFGVSGDNTAYREGLDPVDPLRGPLRDWPMFSGGIQGWNHHPDAAVPYCKASHPDAWRECVGAEWKVDGFNQGDHGAAKSSAVLYDGTIYVGSDTGTLWAFHPNGTALWNASIEPSRNGIHGTPAVAGDGVFIGGYDGAVYRFDRHTGQRVWHTQVGSYIGSSPRLHEGNVYIAVEHGGSTRFNGYADTPASGDVVILDQDTGDEVWRSRTLGSHPHSSVAISPGDNVFVVGCNDDHVYAWDLDDRELRWTFHADGPGEEGDVKGPIAIYDGAAFFGSWDFNYYRVDLETGRADWVFPTGSWAMTGTAVDPDAGIVYFGSHDGRFYAVDAATGDKVWHVQAGARIVGSPTLTGDALYMGANDYHVYAIDKDDGDVLWRYPTKHRISAAPLVVGDRLVFADRSEEIGGGTPGILYSLAPAAQG